MYSRLLVPLLCASAFAFACGPLSHSSEVAPAGAAEDAPADAPASELLSDGAIAATLEVRVGREVEFVLHVTNATEKRLELNFASGRTHDVAVLDAEGQEVWRWSEGRLFTQAMQNRLLGSGETATYQQRWTPRDQTGSFTAVAILASTNHPVELRRGFALP